MSNKKKQGKKNKPVAKSVVTKPMPKKKGNAGGKGGEQTVDKTPKSQILNKVNKDGSRSVYTKKQAIELSRPINQAPERKILLTKPRAVTFTNNLTDSGVFPNWEAIAEGCIFAALAHSPEIKFVGGPAALKFYLWWFMFSRARKPQVQGLVPGATLSSPAVYSSSVLNDFDEENWMVPVAFAKFVQSMMPYTHNKTRYQYIQAFDIMFDPNTPVVGIPTLTGPSIIQPGSSTNVFNRSVFLNNILRQEVLPQTGGAAAKEILWGLDPNTDVVTLQALQMMGNELSMFWNMTGTTVLAGKVPYRAFDGSFYSYVNNAVSQFPSIVSNIENADSELAYIYHVPQNVAVNEAIGDQVYAKVMPIPSVYSQITPTNLGVANMPAQLAMTLNYCYICRDAPWVPGRRKRLLRGIRDKYPKLASFRPSYFMLDLSGFHELKEQCLDQVFNNFQVSTTNIAGVDLRDRNSAAALDTLWECIMLAHVLPITWPSIVIYSHSDFASTTAYSAALRSVVVPPPLADWISGVSPVVSHGCLNVPLLDWRDPNTIDPTLGSTFWGTNPATYDQNNARWIQRLNPPNAVQVPTGFYYPQMFTPSTAAATSTSPSTSLNRGSPFGSGYLITGGNGVIAWTGGFNVIRDNVYGVGIQAPPNPANISRFAPQTPIRGVQDLIGLAGQITMNSSQSFVAPEHQELGSIGLICPVLADSVILQPNNAVPGSGGFASAITLGYWVNQIGALFEMDKGAIGRVAVYAYRRTRNLEASPYIVTLSANNNPAAAVIFNSVRQTPQNAWVGKFIALKTNSDLTDMQVVRAMFERLYQEFAGEASVEAYHEGDAMVCLKKTLRNYSVSPYNDAPVGSVTAFASPSVNNAASFLVQGKRIPILDPALDLGRDIIRWLF